MASQAGGGEWCRGVGAGVRPTFRWRQAAADDAGGSMAAAAAAVNDEGAHTPLMRRLRRGRRCTVATVAILGVLILLVLLAFLAFGKDSADGDNNLLMVSVLFRHGDRTPTDTYPTDPHGQSAAATWPQGMGVLTNEGKMQMFVLGEWLRRRYGAQLLGAEGLYDPLALRMRSSAHPRCLMSAETLLAGLLPPAGPQRWHPHLAWQPVPVHYVAREQDATLAAKKPCGRYDEQLKAAYASAEIQRINSENKEVFEYLANKTGKAMETITDVEFLYNTLLIEKIHGLELPAWTDGVFPDKMKELAMRSYAIFTFNDFMKRIRGGPLLKEIASNMAEKANASAKVNRWRIFLYSAHDLTVVNVWRALGFTELLLVDYGAALIFELRWMQQGEKVEVKVLYLNSSSTTSPTSLRIPNCEEPCEMNMFLEAVRPMLPDDWDKECALA